MLKAVCSIGEVGSAHNWEGVVDHHVVRVYLNIVLSPIIYLAWYSCASCAVAIRQRWQRFVLKVCFYLYGLCMSIEMDCFRFGLSIQFNLSDWR